MIVAVECVSGDGRMECEVSTRYYEIDAAIPPDALDGLELRPLPVAARYADNDFRPVRYPRISVVRSDDGEDS